MATMMRKWTEKRRGEEKALGENMGAISNTTHTNLKLYFRICIPICSDATYQQGGRKEVNDEVGTRDQHCRILLSYKDARALVQGIKI